MLCLHRDSILFYVIFCTFEFTGSQSSQHITVLVLGRGLGSKLHMDIVTADVYMSTLWTIRNYFETTTAYCKGASVYLSQSVFIRGAASWMHMKRVSSTHVVVFVADTRRAGRWLWLWAGGLWHSQQDQCSDRRWPAHCWTERSGELILLAETVADVPVLCDGK